ncbi:MAG TPA: CBS domain-containing protein [Candidatus Gastranaerophilales bacterium]|nr:CBS domain-containing protein [Candidatus Gastranaerophilales bacterium]
MQFYVKDIMSTDLLTIKENISIRDLIKIFSNNEISGLPVLDQDNNIVGVVSLTDVIQNESSQTYYSMPFKKDYEIELLEITKIFDYPVSTIMSKDLFTVEPGDSIAKMAKIMFEKKIHRLLVIEYNKLVGIVTTFDVLKLLATSDESIVV